MPSLPTSGELYGHRVMPTTIGVDVLLPNGMITKMTVSREDRLKKIKDSALEFAKRMPFARMLDVGDKYVFVSVNQDAQREEYYDETRRLCDLRLFLPVLRLIERVGDPEESRRIAEIARMVGSATMNESQMARGAHSERNMLLVDPECIAFRMNVFEELRKLVAQQKVLQSRDKERVALAAYPLDSEVYQSVSSLNYYVLHVSVTAASGLLPPDTDFRQFDEQEFSRSTRTGLAVERNLLELTMVTCLTNGNRIRFRFRTRADCTARQVLDELVKLVAFSRPRGSRAASVPALATRSSSSFILKVAGCSEYLIDADRPVGACRYVRICAATKNRPAEFIVVQRDALILEAVRRAELDTPPSLVDGASMLRDRAALLGDQPTGGETGGANCARVTWAVEEHLRVRLISAAFVQIANAGGGESGREGAASLGSAGDSLSVRVGVFLADNSLCKAVSSSLVDYRQARWNEALSLPICIADLPRAARLTLTLFSVSRQRHADANETEKSRVGFANIPLFTFDRAFVLGRHTVRLWPVSATPFAASGDELESAFALSSASGSYPDRCDAPTLEFEILAPESVSDAVSIQHALANWPVSSSRHSSTQQVPFTLLVFPRDDRLSMHVERSVQMRTLGATKSYVPTTPKEETNLGMMRNMLKSLVQRDPLSDFELQELSLVWDHRLLLRDEFPESLPKVYIAVRWESRDSVVQFYDLLKDWPPIAVETALQLLDATFADLRVREKAVEALNGLTDEQLSAYLLQLTQAIRFEPYADSALARFLLRRSLINQRIGQAFFWHLKADLHQPAVRLRYALLLDTYLNCCGETMRTTLRKQCDALAKLTHLTEELREEQEKRGDFRKDDAIKFLHARLSQQNYLDFVQHLPSPLHQSWQLDTIQIPLCKVMQSKKRPLWLVWRNPDEYADLFLGEYKLIFKNGDDLRQDMLTLQIIRVMDTIWKTEGLEMYVTPYGCVATGRMTGLIEVVQNSRTIMDIQQTKLTSALQMDCAQLHHWLASKNSDSDRYHAAVERFKCSCAAYCVATFVLGIGDRHPDNIMVNENGQVFHIDFGHFLNNRKKKFGIQRERVPFVLRKDFFIIMAHGKDPTDSTYEEFRKICLKAYMGLRKHAHLILTLFSMMVQAGIPELRSHADLEYLRSTLAVNQSDADAEKYFEKCFKEAHEKAWTTSFDWRIHWLNKVL